VRDLNGESNSRRKPGCSDRRLEAGKPAHRRLFQRCSPTADRPYINSPLRPKTCGLFWTSRIKEALCVVPLPIQTGPISRRPPIEPTTRRGCRRPRPNLPTLVSCDFHEQPVSREFLVIAAGGGCRLDTRLKRDASGKFSILAMIMVCSTGTHENLSMNLPRHRI
jgi:hypothetical protein